MKAENTRIKPDFIITLKPVLRMIKRLSRVINYNTSGEENKYKNLIRDK